MVCCRRRSSVTRGGKVLSAPILAAWIKCYVLIARAEHARFLSSNFWILPADVFGNSQNSMGTAVGVQPTTREGGWSAG